MHVVRCKMHIQRPCSAAHKISQASYRVLFRCQSAGVLPTRTALAESLHRCVQWEMSSSQDEPFRI